MGAFEHISTAAGRVIGQIARTAIRRALDAAGDATEAERIREGIHRAELAARILAARILLHEAESLGDWGAIEKRHRRLRELEIEQCLRGWDA